MKIILGSASANRKKVLARMGYSFSIMVADIDEKQIHSEDVRTLPLLIARAKSEALLSRIKEPSILITADQVTLWKEELREKPQDAKEARRSLKTVSGTPSSSLNGITVTWSAVMRIEGSF